MTDPNEQINYAEQHFYFSFYRMLARVLSNLHFLASHEDDRLSRLLTTYPFLAEYEQLLNNYANRPLSEQSAWWDGQIDQLELRFTGHLPLRTLRQALNLSSNQVDLLLAAGMVEENIAFGSLFAYLQDPLPARLPSLGVMGVLLGKPGEPLRDSWEICRDLVDNYLLVVQNVTDPRAEWLIRVPVILWDALRGRALSNPAPGLTLQSRSSFVSFENLVVTDDVREQLYHLPLLVVNRQISALVVRGIGGTGRRTLIGAVAAAAGRDVLLCESLTDDNKKLIGPLATLANAIPILRLNPIPGETVDLPSIAAYPVVLGITLGRSGGVRGNVLEHAVNLTLTPPNAAARWRLWQATGSPLASDAANEITERFLITGGVIYRAAALATTFSQLRPVAEGEAAAIRVPDVQQALRSLNRQALDTLATFLDPVTGWSDLVVSPPIHDELKSLELRCRTREGLQQQAGPAFKRTLNRGVRALFSGPSGTGKTLAARALAGELQMDVYRVDLASIISKYIGETERNLNDLFSQAEQRDLILLLDEGDSVATRRTDVSNSNDRYANLETNYLLQRLEVYEGIVVITTNAAQRIDTAFMRRLDVVIDFAKPDAKERLELWHKHLPEDHKIEEDDLWQVAARCALTGGQIRNAALYVALLGMGLPDEDLPGKDELEKAVQREYRKAGLAYPMNIAQAHAVTNQIGRMHGLTGGKTGN